MSYGSTPKWVTLATWDDLVTRLQSTNPGAAVPAVGRLMALQADTEAHGALVVSGVLHPDGRDVGADLTQSPEITSVISIDTLPDIPPPTEATHRLVLVAPDGEELASQGFAVAPPTHAGLPVEFHQFLPAVAGAAAVELHHDGEVVASANLDEVLSTLSDLDTGTLEGTPPWGELLPIIRSPGLDRVVRPSHSIRFDAQVAGGLTADMEVSWLLDGEPAGDTPTLFLAGLDEGTHELTLQVADGDREGETAVAFTVGADADGDGLWDTWEAEVGLDSTDPSDASTDSDGDRLLAWQEQAADSHPARLDTDGDGYSDTVELDGASDPADSDSVPQVLHGAFGEPVPMVGGGPSSPGSSSSPLLPVAIGAGLMVAGGGWWLLRRRQRTG